MFQVHGGHPRHRRPGVDPDGGARRSGALLQERGGLPPVLQEGGRLLHLSQLQVPHVQREVRPGRATPGRVQLLQGERRPRHQQVGRPAPDRTVRGIIATSKSVDQRI